MTALRRGLWIAVFAVALIGGWTFASGNDELVRVDYGFGTAGAVPLWLALLVSFGLGAGVASLALFARLTRSSLAQRRYRKTVAALETEVHQLRNLPVESERRARALPPPRGGDAPVEAARR